MSVFDILKSWFKKTDSNRQKMTNIDYGTPSSREKPFDFYADDIESKVPVHVSSKNCKCILRITTQQTWTRFIHDEDRKEQLISVETYVQYSNFYKSSNGNYVFQEIEPEGCHGIGHRIQFESLTTRNTMLECYASAKNLEAKCKETTIFMSRHVVKVLNVEVLDKSEFKDVVKEW